MHFFSFIPAIILSATTLTAAGISFWTDFMLPRRHASIARPQRSAQIFYFNDAKSRVASRRAGTKMSQDGRIHRLVSHGG